MFLNRLNALRTAYQNSPRLKKPRKLLRRTWLAVSGSLRAFLGLKSYREMECQGLTFTLEKRNSRRALWFVAALLLLVFFTFQARLPNSRWKTSLLVSPMLVRNGPGAMTDADRNRIVHELRYVKPSLLEKLLATDLSIGVIDHESDLIDNHLLRPQSWPELLDDAKKNGHVYRQPEAGIAYVSQGRFGTLNAGRTILELQERFGLDAYSEQLLEVVRVLNDNEAIKLNDSLAQGTLFPAIFEVRFGLNRQKQLLNNHDRTVAEDWLTEEGKLRTDRSVLGQYFSLRGENKILVSRDGLQKLDHIVLHEVGHAVEHVFRWSEPQEFKSFEKALEGAYEAAGDRRFKISDYSRRNEGEYFAEGFAQYHLRPAQLWFVDRSLYQLIEQAIEQLDEMSPSELQQKTLGRKNRYNNSAIGKAKARNPLWKAAQNNSLRCCARE